MLNRKYRNVVQHLCSNTCVCRSFRLCVFICLKKAYLCLMSNALRNRLGFSFAVLVRVQVHASSHQGIGASPLLFFLRQQGRNGASVVTARVWV